MASRDRSNSLLQRLIAKLARLLRHKPEPEDPYAYRMAPLRRPPNRGGAAAVVELEED